MAGQDSPNDSLGNPITLNATVKLVGVVTGINLFDNRFNDIEVTLSHPTAITPQTGIQGAEVNSVGARLKITCPASMLTIGA